jgi:hypothetical protein
MSGVAVAVGVAAVAGAAISADASRKASNTAADAAANAAQVQKQATDESVAEIGRQYDLSRADLAPWREAGTNALMKIQEALKDPTAYTRSPGYDFRLSEGQKAVERSAAARGNLLGGATQKALTRYGQDYATSEYDNYLNRFYNLAGIGQNATNTGVQAGNQAAGNTANVLMGGANAVGNSLISGGNAVAGGAINQANAITGNMKSGINNYLMWKYLGKN